MPCLRSCSRIRCGGNARPSCIQTGLTTSPLPSRAYPALRKGPDAGQGRRVERAPGASPLRGGAYPVRLVRKPSAGHPLRRARGHPRRLRLPRPSAHRLQDPRSVSIGVPKVGLDRSLGVFAGGTPGRTRSCELLLRSHEAHFAGDFGRKPLDSKGVGLLPFRHSVAYPDVRWTPVNCLALSHARVGAWPALKEIVRIGMRLIAAVKLLDRARHLELVACQVIGEDRDAVQLSKDQ